MKSHFLRIVFLICLAQLIASASVLAKDFASPQTKTYSKNALHRLDCRIQGTSCPVCLIGIEKQIKTLPGIVQTAVMLRKPYGVSIIYDSKQTSQEKIIETAKFNQPKVQIADIKDESISKIPVLLIPPHNEASSTH